MFLPSVRRKGCLIRMHIGDSPALHMVSYGHHALEAGLEACARDVEERPRAAPARAHRVHLRSQLVVFEAAPALQGFKGLRVVT